MRIALIIGTRPEIIKCAPLIHRMHAGDLFIHTNQHYSPEMYSNFINELSLRSPDYNLHTGSGTHAEQTAAVMTGVEKILMHEKPDLVLVHGDTNSSLGGALSASKAGFPVVHIEAGLRSGDRTMPEELNRIVIDQIFEFLFTPTAIQTEFLHLEGISSNKIFEVGNTITDSIYELFPKLVLKRKRDDWSKGGPFALLTLHRSENLKNQEKFIFLIAQINRLAEELPIRFPVHPRTKKRFLQANISLHKNVMLTAPQSYFSFLTLLKEASVVLTDSGGIQEEACILKTPCVTLRTTTERQETLKTGLNRLMSDDLTDDVWKAINETQNGPPPYQPGATEKILKTLGHSQ